MSQPRLSRCKVCRHEERWRIELLRASGASLDVLATKFDLDRDSIWRHWTKHVTPEMKAQYLCGPAQLAELAEKAASEGDSVLDHLRMVRTILTAQLAAVSEAGDARASAFVAGRLTQVLQTIGRVTGEIAEIARGTININQTNNVALGTSPEFGVLLRALGPYPDARLAVVDALRSFVGAGGDAKVIEHAHA